MQGSSDSSLAPGQVLAGKFRVERVLGAGGMGVVVAAEHLQLRQRVALKLLLPEMMQRHDVVARFAREARATASLKNDHVARILDVGALDTGAPYIVMEYLEGCDLGVRLAERGVPAPEDAVGYVLQACEALGEAHGVGIIHRDLKPQNLFLTHAVDGAPLVKVLDFGVSRFADGALDAHLTRTSAVVGSPAYMAPEQMRAARNADERSDVWSLGVILYELLTGELPYSGETMTDLFARIVATKARPPHEVRPEVPAGLSSIVMRCLSVEPAQRPSSVAELSLALAPYGPASARGISERVLAVTRATRPWVADAAVAAVSVDTESVVRVGTARSVVAEPPRRGRVVALAVAGIVVVAGVCAGVIVFAGGRHAVRPEPMPAAASAPATGLVSQGTPPGGSASVSPPAPVASADAIDPAAVDAGTPVAARPVTTRGPSFKPPVTKPAATAPPVPQPQPPAHSTKDDPFQSRTSF
jgi:serine/threonine-protein kinase